MRWLLRTLLRCGSRLTMNEEEWFQRAVEDELQKVIDRIRAKGQDVHNVGSLRNKVNNDLNASRGTSAWIMLKQRYDPMPRNEMRWCCVCERPLSSQAATSWLEDKRGDTYCGQECKDNTARHPIPFAQWKARVKANGSASAPRRDIVGGELVDGPLITITWDDIKNVGKPLPAEVLREVAQIDWSIE